MTASDGDVAPPRPMACRGRVSIPDVIHCGASDVTSRPGCGDARAGSGQTAATTPSTVRFIIARHGVAGFQSRATSDPVWSRPVQVEAGLDAVQRGCVCVAPQCGSSGLLSGPPRVEPRPVRTARARESPKCCGAPYRVLCLWSVPRSALSVRPVGPPWLYSVGTWSAGPHRSGDCSLPPCRPGEPERRARAASRSQPPASTTSDCALPVAVARRADP